MLVIFGTVNTCSVASVRLFLHYKILSFSRFIYNFMEQRSQGAISSEPEAASLAQYVVYSSKLEHGLAE